MMLLEVYYTIRFLKWQIHLVFLRKQEESKKKARRKQEESKQEVKKISSPYTLAATFG